MSETPPIDALPPADDDTRHTHDADLLRRAGEGDQAALGELYDRWARSLHALADDVLHDPDESDDVLHDVFVTLCRNAADFDRAQGTAFSWASTLTRNRAIARLGAREPRTERPSLVAPAASTPSPALRARILNTAIPARADGYRFPFSLPAWLGWVSAGGLFFAAIFFAGKSFNVRGQLQSILEAERVARLESGTLRNLLEAERILSRGQLDHLASADRLIADLRIQADVARLQITSLSSLSGNPAPEARGIAVWNPARQEGVLVVSKLPLLASDKIYQLWIHDPQYPMPVNGGAFTIEPETEEARVNFKPDKNVAVAQTFAVSVEHKGGIPKAEGPTVLTSR